MLGSTMLDVAIGLIVIYSFLALVVTTAHEALDGMLKMRGRLLERAIREMLGDPASEALYQHAVISGLYPGPFVPLKPKTEGQMATLAHTSRRLMWRRRPSYIPSRQFAIALLDTVTKPQLEQHPARELLPTHSATTMAVVRRGIGGASAASDDSPASGAVASAIDTAQGDPNRVLSELMSWYDGAMDRASGRYKRTTQLVIYIIALFITVWFNVDSVEIAKHLYKTPAARNALVARAGVRDSSNGGVSSIAMQDIATQLRAMEVPFGYPSGTSAVKRLESAYKHAAGLLVTMFAISLGAPFWFDLLNKIMIIRSTVKPAEKSQESGSEDKSDRSSPSAGGIGRGSTSPVGALPAGFPARQAPTRGEPGEF